MSQISSDGRYVTFDSDASNLVAGGTNCKCDVFVRDRGTFAPLVTAGTPKGAVVATGANITATLDHGTTRTSANNALTINGVKTSAFGGRFIWRENRPLFNPTTNLTAGTS